MRENMFPYQRTITKTFTQTMVTHTVTYLKMVTHTVTYVSFHTALFNQESRKRFIIITKTATGFPSRKVTILPGVFSSVG